ncbi:MAG: diaminopimelate decarboxylase [Bacteroidetes bacterium]|nr:MAG: diaminopimelate decarboxylase [Bacteroidota bacterium]
MTTDSPFLKYPRKQETLLSAVHEFGTPTFVYDLDRIREQIQLLRTHTEGVQSRLLYAMKANASIRILQMIRDEGMGVDAVSPAELELALRLGFEKDAIFYSANNMTDAEMVNAFDRGVTVNVGELSRLKTLGEILPGSSVCIRLNPQIGAGHHAHVITAGDKSKFGIGVEQVSDVLSIAIEYNLKIVGLHQHIGSGILDTNIVWRAISVLLDAARSFHDLAFINLGGGLGIPYRPDENPLDLSEWESKIINPLRSFREEHPSEDLTFVFEPGRFIVAESGTLLVQVNTVKNSNGQIFAGVDSGMGHLLRPAMYDAYHAIFNLSNPDGELHPYQVVGNICESADFFARDRMIQTIRVGDILAIMDAGAYGRSMSTEYNLRPAPSEVIILNDNSVELVTARESANQMIDRLYPSLKRRSS